MNKPQSRIEEKFNTDHLNDEQKVICCGGGTERPFTGKFWDCKETGIYGLRYAARLFFHLKQSMNPDQGGQVFLKQLSQILSLLSRTEVMVWFAKKLYVPNAVRI